MPQIKIGRAEQIAAEKAAEAVLESQGALVRLALLHILSLFACPFLTRT